MKFDLAGQVFNPEPFVPDADGISWMCTDMAGWDGPSTRQTFIEPSAQHGTLVAQGLHGVRALSMEGVVKAPDETRFWEAYNRLLNLVGNVYQTKVLVGYEGGVGKELYVVRTDSPRIRFIGTGAFNYQLSLAAPDPMKYAIQTQQVSIPAGTSASITNDGSYATRRITVTCTSAGTVGVRNSSDTNVLTTGTDAVEQGTVFDFLARTALYGTKNRYGRLTSASTWWEAQPGSTLVNNIGTADVVLTYKSAWI